MSDTLQRVKDAISALVTQALHDAVASIQKAIAEDILEALSAEGDLEREAHATQHLDAAVAAHRTCQASMHAYTWDPAHGSPSLRVYAPWAWLPEAWESEREDEVLQYFTCPLVPFLEALLYEVCVGEDAENAVAVLGYVQDYAQRFEEALRQEGLLPPVAALSEEDSPA